MSLRRMRILSVAAVLIMIILGGTVSAVAEEFKAIMKAPKNSLYTEILLNGYDGVVYAYNDQQGQTQFRVYGTIGRTKGFYPVSVELTPNDISTGDTETAPIFNVTLIGEKPVKDTSKHLGTPTLTSGTAELPDGWSKAKNKALVFIENLFGEKEYRGYASFNGDNYFYFRTQNSKPRPGSLASVVDDMTERKRIIGERVIKVPTELRKGYSTLVYIKTSDGEMAIVPTVGPMLDAATVRAVSGKSRSATSEVQSRLNTLGYSAGNADGKLGKQTQSALKNFQAANGLPATGVVDAATVAALNNSNAVSANASAAQPPAPAENAGNAGNVTQQSVPVATTKPAETTQPAKPPVITTKNVTEEIKVPALNVRNPNANMMTTDPDKLIQQGVDGKTQVTIKVTYTDGRETEREYVSEQVLVAMKPNIYEYGTKVPDSSEVKEDIKIETITFKTERRENPNVLKTEPERVIQQGVSGTRTIVYQVTYTNGVEVARVVKSDTTVPAKDKIVEVGTKAPPVTTTGQVSETVAIPFGSRTLKHPIENLKDEDVGKIVILNPGVNGSKKITYNVTYVDGKETNRTIASEVVVSQPVDQIQEEWVRAESLPNVDPTPIEGFSYSYEQVGLSTAGLPGVQSEFLMARMREHAMAMAKSAKVYHGSWDTSSGSDSQPFSTTTLMNHSPASKTGNFHGAAQVKVTVTHNAFGYSSVSYYACISTRNEDPGAQ